MSSCPRCGARYVDARLRACPVDGAALGPDAEAPPSSSRERPLRPGEMVGEYQIEGRIGEGGFGVVYRAVQPLIGKRVAVKVLARHYATGGEVVERFVAEARAVNRIRHRNIIDIFSFGVLPDGRHYYVMELLEGETLDELLGRVGSLSPELAIELLRPVARALDAAHSAGIAHRDLKPENIFLAIDRDEEVYPKLLDFGIAKLFTGAATGAKTGNGVPIGTPHYMSPEQCRGRDVDQRTDIYSFGVLTFRAFTGRLPFEGDEVMAVMMAQVSAPPPRPSSVCPSLPPSIDGPLLQMLAKDADARPASMLLAIEALAAACGLTPMSSGGHGRPASLPPLASLPSGPPPRPSSPGGDPSGASGVAFLSVPAARGASAWAAGPEGRAKRASVALGVAALVTIGAGGFWLGRRGGARLPPPLAAAAAAAEALAPLQAAGAAPAGAGAPAAGAGAAPAGAGAAPAGAGAPAAGAGAPAAGAGAPAAGASVRVRVRATPPAEVYWGERRLGGSEAGAFEVPRGARAMKLTLRAEGYKPFELELTPDADRDLSAILIKKSAWPPPPSAPAPPSSRARPRVSGDLENPFD